MTLDQAIQLAVAHHQAGHYADAAAIYRSILHQEPKHPDALHLLGVFEHQEGRHAAAEKLIRSAIEINPNAAAFHSNLGGVLRSLGRHDDAAERYRRATALKPDFHEAWNNLGTTLNDQGKFAEAIVCHRKAIELQPHYAMAYNNLASAQRGLARFSDAEQSLRMAVRLSPRSPEVLRNLAFICRQLKKTEEAMAAARAAIGLAPDYPDAYHILGLALEDAGRRDEAVESLRTAVRLKPDSNWQFELDALSGGAPAAPPREFVRSLFDDYAPYFDQHLVDHLGYVAPQLLFDAVRRVETATDLRVLDLGCGTGLGGVVFKPIANRLVGVDLAPRMVEAARERKIYDSLHVGDIAEFMRALNETFDVIIAADVLVYVGDLKEIFEQLMRLLRPGGVLAFTTEAHEGAGFILQRTRRYTHSAEYLKTAAAASGLEVVLLEPAVTRKNQDRDVAGWLQVLRKPK